MSPIAYIGTVCVAGRPVRPRTAVVVEAGRVAAVLPVHQLPAGVRRHDAGDALITPGFVDAHVHLGQLGLQLGSVDLSGCRTAVEALDRVRRHALRSRAEPIIGSGWDDADWPDADRLAAGLGTAAPDRAVYLSRVDVHSALVSSAFVALADPTGGLPGVDGFEPGPAGTAIVRRAAHHAVREVVTSGLGRPQRRAALVCALRLVAARGLVCVHELGAPHLSAADDMALLDDIGRTLPVPQVVRYWGQHADDGGIDHARELGCVGAAGDLCADGSIGSRTAALAAPYADAPDRSDDRGSLYLDTAAVTRHLRACTAAGIAGGFHCIGDAAVDAVLEGLDQVAAEFGAAAVRRCRHRLEHLELWPGGGRRHGEIAGRLAQLGVVASMQPAFDATWGGPGGLYQTRLGAARADSMNPLARLARAGVALAFGSDAPVTPPAPWAGIRAALAHHTPAERLDFAQAFAAHTAGGWYAAGCSAEQSYRRARLAPGAPADLAIWPGTDVDAALATTDPPTTALTLCNGQVVHDAARSSTHDGG